MRKLEEMRQSAESKSMEIKLTIEPLRAPIFSHVDITLSALERFLLVSSLLSTNTAGDQSSPWYIHLQLFKRIMLTSDESSRLSLCDVSLVAK